MAHSQNTPRQAPIHGTSKRITAGQRRAEQRAPNADCMSFEEGVERFVTAILRDTGPAPTVLIGPLIWRFDPASDRRHWHCAVASADADGTFRIDVLGGRDRDLAKRLRAAVMIGSVRRKPVVVNGFNDELKLARQAEALWPCARTRAIRAGVEQGRTIAGVAVE